MALFRDGPPRAVVGDDDRMKITHLLAAVASAGWISSHLVSISRQTARFHVEPESPTRARCPITDQQGLRRGASRLSLVSAALASCPAAFCALVLPHRRKG
jgi:hypothetical protein